MKENDTLFTYRATRGKAGLTSDGILHSLVVVTGSDFNSIARIQGDQE